MQLSTAVLLDLSYGMRVRWLIRPVSSDASPLLLSCADLTSRTLFPGPHGLVQVRQTRDEAQRGQPLTTFRVLLGSAVLIKRILPFSLGPDALAWGFQRFSRPLPSQDTVDFAAPTHIVNVKAMDYDVAFTFELHEAASEGGLRWMQRLIEEEDVDPHTADDGGATAMHYAAMNGHIEAMDYLLDHGVDINIQVQSPSSEVQHARFCTRTDGRRWLGGTRTSQGALRRRGCSWRASSSTVRPCFPNPDTISQDRT